MDFTSIASVISGTDLSDMFVAIMGILVGVWAFRKAAGLIGR